MIPTSNAVMRSLPVPAVLLVSAAAVAAAPAVEYERDVRPILVQHCYQCHGPDKQKSGLRLDVRDAVFQGGEYHAPTIVPGDAEASNLVRFVRGDDQEMRMPKDGAPLSAEEVAILTDWIDQGALWPEGIDDAKLEDRTDHWSFKPLAEFGDERDLDSFVREKLLENGLSMAIEADRTTWLRRVSLDLTGLPPTPEQVHRFLADRGEGAHARVVDELLASPRYGERWGQHWLDVVRYADTEGFEVNTPRDNAWPYRDYVIAAFNDDTPYDQFIREQIAGDLFGRDAATGFLVTAARLLPGQIGKDPASMRLARQDELGEIVINTSEALLALSVGCARCHNHKFDAVSAKDYYAMQAFFAGVSYGDRPIRSPEADAVRGELEAAEKRLRDIERLVAGFVPPAGSGIERPSVHAALNVERFAPVKAKHVRFTIRDTNLYEPCIDELEVFDSAGHNVALASAGTTWSASGSNVEANRHQPEFINDGEYGNSRSWMCNSVQGWIMLTFPAEHEIDRIVWGRDRNGEFSDRLAVDYVIEAADAAGTWRVVADSSDRRREPVDGGAAGGDIPLAGLDDDEKRQVEALVAEKQAIETRMGSLRSRQVVFGGVFGDPDPTHLLNRGDPEQPKEEVAPAVLSALGSLALPVDAPDHERRRVLADWLSSPENPLTARVMVNRIWQGHFGIGIVETTNDFGRAGALPSHPELLDWLAGEFIRSGWSIKHVHRLIVLSDTYRQSSRVDARAQDRDADVRLLWRYPSRRLEAEAIRDGILAVSGELNLKIGGPGFDLFEARGGLSGFPPVESFSGDGLRRMIYAHKIRMEPDAVFGAFDCPDAGQSVSRRRQSTTPIQALNLFNSRFVIDRAEAFARRLQAEAGSEVEDQIRRAWWLAYARDPDSDEITDAASVVETNGLATLCRVILNTNEFLFIP